MAPIRAEDPISVEFEDCASSWGFVARWQGRQVGYLWAQIEGTRLKINDFQVQNALPIPWPVAHDFLITIGIRCRTRNFRNQGIGSKLMDRLLTETKRSKITEIWGYVVSKDLLETPHLLDFYERKGFRVVAPDDECPKAAKQKIVLSFPR